MTTYYECHVTFTCDAPGRELAEAVVAGVGWRFSAIDGDTNLGAGVKLYATKQFNSRHPEAFCVEQTVEMAAILGRGPISATILRRKVERVLWDDRSSKVQCLTGDDCAACIKASEHA